MKLFQYGKENLDLQIPDIFEEVRDLMFKKINADYTIDLLHELALTLNPTPKLGRGTLKLAPLLSNLATVYTQVIWFMS